MDNFYRKYEGLIERYEKLEKYYTFLLLLQPA